MPFRGGGIEPSQGLSVHLDRALIRLVSTRRNLYQRRFTSAVLPQQRVYLPGFQVKIHAAQCPHRTKGLADVFETDQRGRRRHKKGWATFRADPLHKLTGISDPHESFFPKFMPDPTQAV